MYCLSLYSENFNSLKKIQYTPVGLGNNIFTEEWLRDNTKINISHKNKYYGEYSFHYWFWKNMIDEIDENQRKDNQDSAISNINYLIELQTRNTELEEIIK
jgi:hypothetical protein